jgi:hypothetical protein
VPSSSKSPHVSSSGGSKAVEGNNDAVGASEADLRALFNSIDVDGSGALQTLTGDPEGWKLPSVHAHWLHMVSRVTTG